MKQPLFKTLLLLGCVAVLASCVQETGEGSIGPKETIQATVSQEPMTKVGFDDSMDGDGLHLFWEDGDCIRVISGNQSEKYDILEDFDEQTARFRGAAVSGSTYTILYPGTYSSVAGAEAFDFAGQVQNGNGNKDHLRYLAVLQDVNTKEDISFTSEWAAAHGGSYKQNGVVKFVLTLPAQITSPRKVVLSGLGQTVAVALKNIRLGSDRVLTAYAVTPWADIDMPSGSNVAVTVTAQDGGTWTRNITIQNATALKAGHQSIVRLTKGFSETLFAGGSGTEADPYLISGAKHVFNMNADGVLEQGKKTWFKMIDDVDMSSVDASWVPLNAVNPYGCEVDFDGGGHTIDNFYCDATDRCPGFFTVLYGSMHDVSFTNAEVIKSNDQNGHPVGIIAGYGGYEARPTVVYNVHVQGSVNAQNVNGVGGMFGRVNSIDIESCSADVRIYARNNYVGGIFGYDTGRSFVRNCWTSGSLEASQRVGGICGGPIKSETAIVNCYSLCSILASFCMGGIGGHCNLDKASSVSPGTTYPDNVFEKCIAWNEKISARNVSSGDKSHYSGGAIVAYTSTHNYLTDCMRRADLDFQEYSDLFGLYDQANSTPDNPLSINTVSGANYNFPYHGKAAPAGSTLSQVARSLGWDSEIWDMSGSVPVLTGKAIFEDHTVASGDSNAPVGTNPKPGAGEVRPSAGNGWTVTQIADGITYYTFSGNEPITGVKQQVFAIDLDLNNPKYKLKFVRKSSINSAIFAENNAIVSINGGYELGSIVFKADGIGYSYMPNNVITTENGNSVPNWKSEGAFYYDPAGNVAKIRFDGYGLSVSQQRMFYTYHTGEWPNIVSSAPMLVYEYNPVGETFVDPSLTDAQIKALGNQCTENPNYHQWMTHPRQSVSITAGNHLILCSVDGRHSGYSVGMSAKSLTRFLVANFNPRWAINLDGGGSTTMCVRGQGDSSTHVVNYPCDNSTHDHAGERSVSTHICIVER